VHAVIKTVRYSGTSVTAARAAVRNTVSGDYATPSKLTVVGIARGTLSGD